MKKKQQQGELLIVLLKTVRIMRLIVFMIITSSTLAFSATSYSQNTALTLELNNATVKEIIQAIEAQSEFLFFYQERHVDVNRRVTLHATDQDVETILDQVFAGTDNIYVINDRQIVLGKAPRRELERQMASLRENFSPFIQQPLQKEIRGKVTDTGGLPLPGVSVIVKGTTVGTVTNADGEFTLMIPVNADILQFSFVGMKSQDVPVEDNATFLVAMEEETIGIDEVVAIGYGVVKKSDLTGSIFSIREDELKSGISENIDGKIKGKIPGVTVMQTSGNPGSQPRIRIRGTSSVTGGNSPLYIIDGVPFDDQSLSSGLPYNQSGAETSGLNLINVADIESMEVLKGASATAIYGSRGTNGVILITTKRGRENKVNYDFDGGVKTASKKLDLLTSDEYIRVRNEIAQEYDEPPVFSESDIANIKGSDWQDEILRLGSYQNHTISFSGGNNVANYYASLNYFDESGIIINSGIKKYNARLNLDLKSSERLSFGIRINLNRTDDDLIQEGASNERSGVIGGAHILDPTLSNEKQPNGRYLTGIHMENPLNSAEGYIANRLTNSSYGVATLKYQITPELSGNIKLGMDQRNAKKTVYLTRQMLDGLYNNGQAYVYNAYMFNYLSEITFTYNKQIKDHSLNLLGGATYEKFSSDNNNIEISNFPTDATLHYNLGLGDTEVDYVTSGYGAHALLSFFTRANYIYKNKYLATFTFRADGSSRFGPNNKYGYFPSLAFAWRMSEEPFVSGLDFISNLKPRISWGVTGNQDIGNYMYLPTFERGGDVTINNTLISILRPARIPNSNLKWEEKEEYNAGLDFGVYEGRVSGSFDFFRQVTRDLLFNKPVPRNSGFSSMLENIGKVRNQGIEVLIETRNLTGEFSWNTTLNFAHIKNKVLDLGPVEEIIHGSVATTSQIGLIRVGEPINSYYGHQVLGIWQEGEDIANSAQPNAKPGYIKFKNQNDDKKIDEKDLVPLGNPDPDFTYGLTNSFSYKNFDLSIFIQGMEGVELLSGTYIRAFYPVDYTNNRMAEPWLNRWTPANPTNKYPSGVDYNLYGGSLVNDLTIQDASYLRLQNVQLSYNIPVEGIKSISSANVSIMANNLLTLTKYNGYNPEAAQSTNMVVRADFNNYPLARTYAIGVKLEF